MGAQPMIPEPNMTLQGLNNNTQGYGTSHIKFAGFWLSQSFDVTPRRKRWDNFSRVNKWQL